MSMLDHPLFGDYAFNKFGVIGSAICYDDIRPVMPDNRISVHALGWGSPRSLAFSDGPPEGHPRRRFQFGIPLRQIELMLPWREGTDATVYFVQGPHIGQVDHVLGREAEDYIDKGSTAQMLADCTLRISADAAGLIFEFAGSLSNEGFLRPVEPTLKKDAYVVRAQVAWQAARFFFSTNSLVVMFDKFGKTRGEG